MDKKKCSEDGPRTTICAGGSRGPSSSSSSSSSALGPPARNPATTSPRISNHGQSERFPLGKDRHPSVILLQQKICQQQNRYPHGERSPFLSTTSASANRYLGSSNTDRYTNLHGTLERYYTSSLSRTPTPSSERHNTVVEKKYILQQNETVEATAQDNCSSDIYTSTERHRKNSKSDIFKIRERSISTSESKEMSQDHLSDLFQSQIEYERPSTPSILECPPAPPPFGSGTVSEPPSPAPTCDRFIAPPQQLDGDTDTTDCYAHGTFPSPVAPASQERFLPPSVLPTPSPTEDRSTNKQMQRYHDKYHIINNSNQSSDSYYQTIKHDRYQVSNSTSSASTSGGLHQSVKKGDQRFNDAQRQALPPNAHTPIERYVPQPQPQESYCSGSTYDRYSSKPFHRDDPYMRRDLSFQYRMPIHYPQNQYQKLRYSHVGTPLRPKCCQYDGPRSSSGSSSTSNSSVTSGNTVALQDNLQCQIYQQAHFAQEKATQYPIVIPTANVPSYRTSPSVLPCRHVACDGIEYVGASGGRRICATPPPPRSQERCEGCMQAAAQAAAAAAASSSTQTPPQQIGQMQTIPTSQTMMYREAQGLVRSLDRNGRTPSHQLKAWRAIPVNQQQCYQPPQQQQYHHHGLIQNDQQVPSTSTVSASASTATVVSQLTPRHIQNTRSLTPTASQRTLLNQATNVPHQAERCRSPNLVEKHDKNKEETVLKLRTISSQNRNSNPSTSTTAMDEPKTPSNLSNLENQPTTSTQPANQSLVGTSSAINRSNISIKRALSLPDTPSEHQQKQRHRERSQDEETGAAATTIGGRSRINYSQSERIPQRERPALNRSQSKREIIKNYIRKEAANFFGVSEENEDEEQQRWLDRRKRMASRTMGPLKDEYATLTHRPQSLTSPIGQQRHRRAISEFQQPFSASYLGGVSRQMDISHPDGERPDVLPSEMDEIDSSERRGLRRKDSVARITWNGLNYVVTTLSKRKPSPRSHQNSFSRSFPRMVMQAAPADAPALPAPDEQLPSPDEEAEIFFQPTTSQARQSYGVEREEIGDRTRAVMEVDRGRKLHLDDVDPISARYLPSPSTSNWQTTQSVMLRRHSEQRPMVGSTRILPNTLNNISDNSNRRQYGLGWLIKFFGHSYRKSVVTDARIQEQLDDMDDNRPFFTYWVTTVQILVLLISVACYGFGPFGVDLQSRSGQVLVTSLSLQQVDYMEPANFWLGPRAADLIHLGAKFAPCMRVDSKISQKIDKARYKEKETACCIRNDDSGCVQSSQADCSKTISTWKKWTSGDTGPGGRISGSVCGLDPKYCEAPASVHPYEWPDDITKWPICRKTNSQLTPSVARREKGEPRDKLAEHMVCEVIGHPCCIGIHGQCRITTREYCDFVHGSFHEEASLCSQVSCLNDVCGMIPFFLPDKPDQLYRLWTSIFLHAGILQLIITILVQYFLMRDLEKLTGSLRIGIIYMGSGIGGNLASAIFVPYRADVGPSGSQFGLLACLIVEVLNAWPMLKNPRQALSKLLFISFGLFIIGLLPWVDNYAHLFGFLFGFLLSYALLPFVSFGHYDRKKKILLIWVCLLIALILFIILLLLFCVIPVYDCKICSYLNCLPLTRDFCASQNINFKREDLGV